MSSPDEHELEFLTAGTAAAAALDDDDDPDAQAGDELDEDPAELPAQEG